MGIGSKGRDSDLGRDVAVKVLSRHLVTQAGLPKRFVDEAQIGGQLQHPDVVPVHELGMIEDECPYFTMKRIQGRTLADLHSERAGLGDDRRRFLSIFEAVFQTIAYAHSKGVIHRDPKPVNIMVGALGEVQVVDRGLARVLRERLSVVSGRLLRSSRGERPSPRTSPMASPLGRTPRGPGKSSRSASTPTAATWRPSVAYSRTLARSRSRTAECRPCSSRRA